MPQKITEEKDKELIDTLSKKIEQFKMSSDQITIDHELKLIVDIIKDMVNIHHQVFYAIHKNRDYLINNCKNFSANSRNTSATIAFENDSDITFTFIDFPFRFIQKMTVMTDRIIIKCTAYNWEKNNKISTTAYDNAFVELHISRNTSNITHYMSKINKPYLIHWFISWKHSILDWSMHWEDFIENFRKQLENI